MSFDNNTNTFDLDINNYTIRELINFFKLADKYSLDDLDSKEGELINTILKVYKDSDITYRNEIVQFIKTGKQILTGKIQPFNDNKRINRQKNEYEPDTYKNNDSTPSTIDESSTANITNSGNSNSINGKPANNIGKIINPASVHPSLQKQSILPNSINGYNVHTITSNYILNTLFRDNYFNSISSSCSFTLPTKIKNVISLSLSGIQIPNVSNTFSAIKETNQLYIYEDITGLNAIVAIPFGNYSSTTYPPVLEEAINLQVIGTYIPGGPNRFTVGINSNNNTIYIKNSTYTFRMNIVKKVNNVADDFNCQNRIYNLQAGTNYDDVDAKLNLKPSDYTNTMGYIVGFRRIEYTGLKSYSAESPFNDSLQDYYYFELNDYNDYQSETTFGILPTYVLSKNIIAVLPITTPKYIASFDNNSNFIYKTRNYNAPVDISKISIKFLNPQGGIVDLHYVDFAFCLQVTTVYDNLMPYNTNDVSII